TGLNRAHPHDALVLVHAHCMNFKFFGNRRRTANQSVRLASGVRDRDVPGRYGRPLGDRPGPWVIDFKRAEFAVISARTGGESENTSDQDAELLHGTSPRLASLARRAGRCLMATEVTIGRRGDGSLDRSGIAPHLVKEQTGPKRNILPPIADRSSLRLL